MSLTHEEFGTTEDGQSVRLFRLALESGMAVSITNFGGIIQSIRVPDRQGTIGDVVLGFDSLTPYLSPHPFFGALVGRYANRIGGARFPLDGHTVQLEANNGPNHLHGGRNGFDKQVWEPVRLLEGDEPGLQLSYHSPDGQGHYPGALTATVTYTLQATNALRIDYTATTDAPTIVNLTNHSYFNLAGESTIHDHDISLYADFFTPIDNTLIPTGEVRPVAGSPFDLRRQTPIGSQIDADDDQIRLGGGYDHNFVVQGPPGALRPAARVSEASSGRVLEVKTTQPGIQFYSGNMLPDRLAGKNGQFYGKRSGFCLETQNFPDAPNKPQFPSPILRPGMEYRHTTVFHFSTMEG